ncbi:MAG: tyrosine recombinase XerC [Clostridia bacterium]|nr:tyrosine recombinase XerC [Clostridia bacterium]MBR5768265.1 tyrosine recombinase XerC [Clostridia bacterium]
MPQPITEFLQYLLVIKGRSKGTAEQYRIDLVLLFKYVFSVRNGLPLSGGEFDALDISRLDDDFAKSITKTEIIAFLAFASADRGNNARTRARKLSSVRSFYKYFCGSAGKYPVNPTENIDSPKIPKTLPKHLTKDESTELLRTVMDDESKFTERNFCIITLFLNCGMRLSELVGINLRDIDRDMKTLRVTGKGAKERMIYLNDACRAALTDYLKKRDKNPEPGHRDALFLSSRHRRISKQMVQAVVYRYLKEAGLDNRGLSVHKLRHTAATLMYQTGQVDIRVLKDILGHEQLNTTQIYTHLSDESMKQAMDVNPLAGFSRSRPSPDSRDGDADSPDLLPDENETEG